MPTNPYVNLQPGLTTTASIIASSAMAKDTERRHHPIDQTTGQCRPTRATASTARGESSTTTLWSGEPVNPRLRSCDVQLG